MLNRARLGISIVCLAAFAAAATWAQAPTGAMNGSVKDPTGAVMPGVSIDVINKDTGAERKETSGADGNFNVAPLAPGLYSVKAEAQGFRTIMVDATVQVGQVTTADLVMQVGA